MYGYHFNKDNKSVQNFKEGLVWSSKLHWAKILTADCTLSL